MLYTWESGRRFPTARRFFEVAERAGVDTSKALRGFFRSDPEWLQSKGMLQQGGVPRLLAELQGNRSIFELARATGKSRFAVARWLSGQTEPRLPDFLLLVEATSYRLLDFVAALVDPARLPCHPRRLARAHGGEAGRVHVPLVPRRVAPAGDRPHRGPAQRRRRRHRRRARPLRGRDLFCVSESDYRKLQSLHRAYYRQLRAIVAESAPSERVVMANLQLFSLSR